MAFFKVGNGFFGFSKSGWVSKPAFAAENKKKGTTEK